MTQWLYIRVYSVKMGFKACNCNTYKPIYEMDNPVGNKKKKTTYNWTLRRGRTKIANPEPTPKKKKLKKINKKKIKQKQK